MDNNIKITDDIIALIKGIIENFGGIDNTENITGVSKSSLKKYVERKTDKISYKVWNEKLLPYTQPNIFNKISERIKLIKEELTDYKMGFYNQINNKYEEIEKIKNNTLSKESLKDLFYNPLFCYNEYYYEFENISQSLIKRLEKLKDNVNFSYSDVIYSLIQFADYYEHFRPNKIENDDLYWGTVKIMDENYFILLKYLKCDRLFITFTKSPGEEYYIFQGCKTPEHNQIDWDQTIKEFKDISSKILKTIGINAIRAYYILGKYFP